MTTPEDAVLAYWQETASLARRRWVCCTRAG
jgi:hypothetical protein